MKKKIFKINYKVYPFDVLVCFGSDTKEILQYLKKYKIELSKDEEVEIEMTGNGRTVMLDSGQTIIRLKHDYIPTISHEVFHAVHFLFDRIGLDLCLESGEAYAYLTQYLTQEILKGVLKK